MKIELIAAFLLLAGISSMAAAQEKKNSKFHFLTFNCEESEREEMTADATPQSPPLEVDDPGTPGCNAWEINLTFSGDMAKDEKEYELPLLDMNYGVGDNLQLKYEVPFLLKDSNEGDESGFGNSKFGVKWQFREDEENGLDMALYPQIEFANPGSNSVDKGIAERGTLFSMPLLVTKGVGGIGGKEVTLTGNVGYNWINGSSAPDFVNVSLGAGIPLSNKLAVMCDLVGEYSLSDNPETEKYDRLLKGELAVMMPLGNVLTAYGTIGRSLYTSENEDHTYFVLGLRASL